MIYFSIPLKDNVFITLIKYFLISFHYTFSWENSTFNFEGIDWCYLCCMYDHA